MKILLDYFFPITSIDPTPAASTAFLKQVCIVVAPKVAVPTGVATLCTSMTAVGLLTDNVEAQQLFDAGKSRVWVLPMSSLALATPLATYGANFFTVLISSDFSDANVTAMTLGTFTGVVGVSSADDAFLAVQAAIANRAPFHTTTTNDAKNMFYAFGKLLANELAWRNQQYIPMPLADDVDTLGEAEALFEDRVNFVISDDEFGNRLGLFCAGGKAIVAPYIKKNLEIDMQSAALSYVSGNQPAYTLKEAALVQDELQKVIQGYIDEQQLESGVVEVSLVEDNFVASAEMNISEPKALWRIVGELRQTL
jgi:hypothetical protein